MNQRYFLIVACLLFWASKSYCQDTLKSFNNQWGTELNFNPFDGSLSFNNASGQIKLRRFYNINKAFRLSVATSYKQDNVNLDSPYGSSPINSSDRKQSLFISVNIGNEKHFIGSRRLSPYAGWEVGAGYKTSKHITNDNTYSKNIKGAWAETVSYNNGQSYYYNTVYNERGFWSVGANFVTGFDFYMTKGFYLGYELLFGVDYISYSNIDITTKNYPPNSSSSTSYPDHDDESWKFGPKLVNGIRIGYVF